MSELEMTAETETEDLTDELSDEALDCQEARFCNICFGCRAGA
jgi:hypothetical protein